MAATAVIDKRSRSHSASEDCTWRVAHFIEGNGKRCVWPQFANACALQCWRIPKVTIRTYFRVDVCEEIWWELIATKIKAIKTWYLFFSSTNAPLHHLSSLNFYVCLYFAAVSHHCTISCRFLPDLCCLRRRKRAIYSHFLFEFSVANDSVVRIFTEYKTVPTFNALRHLFHDDSFPNSQTTFKPFRLYSSLFPHKLGIMIIE